MQMLDWCCRKMKIMLFLKNWNHIIIRIRHRQNDPQLWFRIPTLTSTIFQDGKNNFWNILVCNFHSVIAGATSIFTQSWSHINLFYQEPEYHRYYAAPQYWLPDTVVNEILQCEISRNMSFLNQLQICTIYFSSTTGSIEDSNLDVLRTGSWS
jgi:hypothetical protein